jgi:hypothetical protein
LTSPPKLRARRSRSTSSLSEREHPRKTRRRVEHHNHHESRTSRPPWRSDTTTERTAAIRNAKNALQLSHLPAYPKRRLQEGDGAGHRRRPTKVVGFHPGAGGGRGGGSWISKPPSRRKQRLERRRRRGRRSRPRNYSDPKLPTPHPRSPPPDPAGLTRRKQQHGGAVFRSGEGE